MTNDSNPESALTRRDFLRVAGLGAAALSLGSGHSAEAAATRTEGDAPSMASRAAGPYNILLIVVDQERLFRAGELPAGYSLPAHERLMQRGTTFLNPSPATSRPSSITAPGR
ncbi:twin-arginine translocation signal domain-containing protein [Cupriavidus sp. H39]|uniref:twin-arginine translocation signal domain-containing protein n=1 Tax=Cupriavidus sp. H39 TaxID=3401635 RepID=UPI003D025DBF